MERLRMPVSGARGSRHLAVLLVALTVAGVAGRAPAETNRLEVADWADVVRDGAVGAPTRRAPNTEKVLDVGFWGPIGSDCHYTYVKFDIPADLADKEILSATFHAYNLGWVSEYECGTIFSYIENDNWTRETPDPFPMYREPHVFPQSQFAGKNEWYSLDVTPYLFMPGEGPGRALTLQLEQGGSGLRGLRATRSLR